MNLSQIKSDADTQLLNALEEASKRGSSANGALCRAANFKIQALLTEVERLREQLEALTDRGVDYDLLRLIREVPGHTLDRMEDHQEADGLALEAMGYVTIKRTRSSSGMVSLCATITDKGRQALGEDQ